MSKHLYAIVDGEVHPFNCYKKYTEIDALVAYANTEEHAMELATMYEHGEIEPAAGVRNVVELIRYYRKVGNKA